MPDPATIEVNVEVNNEQLLMSALNSDDSDKDPDYAPEISESSSSDEESPDAESQATSTPDDVKIIDEENQSEKVKSEKKGRKRKRNESLWIKNINKKLRNTGQAYNSSSKSGRSYEKRVMKQPCGEKCKLKCTTKITETERQRIFSDYWSLGDIERQRDFIKSSMTTIVPKYRYIKEGSIRQPNNAFHFSIAGKTIRVCKIFFKATLGINDRPIRTVLSKQTYFTSGMISEDQRGKHKNHHTVSPDIKQDIHNHIDSIPKVDSHYTRSHSCKQYIDGSKTLADLHRDYTLQCQKYNKPFGNYFMYHRIFNEEYNLSFFSPKKDQCDVCIAFDNANQEEKQKIKTEYEDHLRQKDLSRKEKESDKMKVSKNYIVTCYDLQQVLPCPNGDVSVFYYTSKLNVLNFTLFELKNNTVQCFLWHEGEALRGANEIGTCVLKYIEEKAHTVAPDEPLHIVFYSDNCCGQQKNRFLIAMYMYAVMNYNVTSITHKFLIRGHTQNENDCCHSVIEQAIKRVKKSGPIYTPDQYVSVIRLAKKKGDPYKVTELCHEDIIDLKDVAEKIGINVMKNTENQTVKITEIKILKIEKKVPYTIFYKTGYDEENFREVVCKRLLGRKANNDASSIILKPAYKQKQTINEKKKVGLLALVEKNLIPKSYSNFYQSL